MKRVALLTAVVSAPLAQASCFIDFNKVRSLSFSYHWFGSPGYDLCQGCDVSVDIGRVINSKDEIILTNNTTPPIRVWYRHNSQPNRAQKYGENLVNATGIPLSRDIRWTGELGDAYSHAKLKNTTGMWTSGSLKHNSYYPPQWVEHMPTRIEVTDAGWCNNAYQSYYGEVLYRHTSSMPVTLTDHWPSTTTTYTFELQGTMTIPFSSTVSPSSIAFGNVSVGDTGVRALSVRTNAFPGAKHSISFVYTSDSGTQETLTVDNNRLPYTAKRTLPSNASSASDVFNIRIASSTAANVTGRLQVTNRLD